MERVFVIGATGKVGREFVSKVHDGLGNADVKLVGVASSTSFLYDPDGLGKCRARKFAAKKISGEHYEGSGTLLDLLREDECVRIIDVTASADMLKFHKRIMEETGHTIVTANKLPLVLSTFDEFQALTSDASRYGYSCSVMAGAGAVPFLRESRDLGEMTRQIAGCFSGTLSYISCRLEKGCKLSRTVAKAVGKGYAEPNPAVDLSGRDVAAKLLILARTAGIRANMKDISLTPFVPQEYISCGKEYLIANLEKLDAEFGRLFRDAKREGCSLRYVAELKAGGAAPDISVGMQKLRLGHQLAQLKGTANKVIICTGPYGSNGNRPYSLEAPGAGIDVTARNIRRDLLHQLRMRD